MQAGTGRIIGIRHRVKRTAEGEARPTLVAIKEGGEIKTLNLDEDQDELDFLLGRFPASWREATPEDDLTAFPEHHVRERKKRGTDDEKVKQVPDSYEGYRNGDVVVMLLGGSGDRFAFALSRRGEEIGAKVYRTPAFEAIKHRGEEKENDHINLIGLFEANPDSFYLVDPADRNRIQVSLALRQRRDTQKDRIACGQRLRQRVIGEVFLTQEGRYPEGTIEAAIKAAEDNDVVFQILVKEEDKRTKELQEAVHRLPAWNAIFKPIKGVGEVIAAGIMGPVGDVRRFTRANELEQIRLNRLEILRLDRLGRRAADAENIDAAPGDNHYQRTLKIIAYKRLAGKNHEAAYLAQTLPLMKANTKLIWAPIHRFKAFCGVHLVNGYLKCLDCQAVTRQDLEAQKETGPVCHSCGSVNVVAHAIFPRQRRGQVGNWNPWVRQAFYNLSEQFNKRPDSEWGQKLRTGKAGFRQKHQEVIVVGGKKRYTDGHIHSMGRWRTLTKFAESLFHDLYRLETTRGGETPTMRTPGATPIGSDLNPGAASDGIEEDRAIA